MTRVTRAISELVARRAPCALVAFVLLSGHAVAQEAPIVRTYFPDRADEDWSFLRDRPDTDFWDPAKYIGLGREDRFMTLSGELRYRAEGFRIRATDTRPSTIDNYLLQRYLTGADVHFNSRVRFFTELQSGIINGKLQSPRPTDRDSLDVHQGFAEWTRAGGSRRVSVKVGRQELAIGSTRLISASPGLNVKRSFDGARVLYGTRSWLVAGAAARLVIPKGGTFDDASDSGQLFWGVAATGPSPLLQRGDVGAYYLGIDRDQSVYAQEIAPERRHTVGLKWTGIGERLALNYDALFQWGTFGGDPIRAWAFATETSYQIATTGWQPRVNVRADIASGDRDPANPHLEAFNPLFPGNSYSGAVGLLGPTNLTDLTPALTVRPRPGLIVGFEAPSYWRTSLGDGVYTTDQRLIARPGTSGRRYIGTNPGVLVTWQATTHVQLQGAITRFLAGAFLEDSFVSSGFGFYSTTFLYRF